MLLLAIANILWLSCRKVPKPIYLHSLVGDVSVDLVTLPFHDLLNVDFLIFKPAQVVSDEVQAVTILASY